MLIATPVGEWSKFSLMDIPFNGWAGLIYLIVFGSLIAYLAFNWLVTVQPPALVSTHTYVNPIVAVAMGSLLANEKIVGMQVIALVIVLARIVLAQLESQEQKHP